MICVFDCLHDGICLNSHLHSKATFYTDHFQFIHQSTCHPSVKAKKLWRKCDHYKTSSTICVLFRRKVILKIWLVVNINHSVKKHPWSGRRFGLLKLLSDNCVFAWIFFCPYIPTLVLVLFWDDPAFASLLIILFPIVLGGEVGYMTSVKDFSSSINMSSMTFLLPYLLFRCSWGV